jgi:hypothetical protein
MMVPPPIDEEEVVEDVDLPLVEDENASISI